MEVPEAPDVPDVPEVSDVPDVSEVLRVPEDSEAPELLVPEPSVRHLLWVIPAVHTWPA
jgi:hypothetical protein